MIKVRLLALPVLILLATLTMSLGVACGSDDGDSLVFVGEIINIDSSSATALTGLQVVNSRGISHWFEARGFVGMTLSQLRSVPPGSEITIEYFEEDGQLIISAITD